MSELKVCTSCGVPKPLAEFHYFGKDRSRVGKWCEACYLKKKGPTKPESDKIKPS